jgi:hypothetical protein
MGIVAVIACSSGGSASSGQGGTSATGGQGGAGGTPSDWKQRCQDVVDHNRACGKSKSDQAAADQCVAAAACVPSVWSASVVDSIMSCLATLPCSNPDDDCIAATQSLMTPTKLSLMTACQDKSAACPGFQGCLETLFLVSDSLAQQLQACLSQACDAASSCMTNEYFSALTAAGCNSELPFGG